jgi:hypothetical protein
MLDFISSFLASRSDSIAIAGDGELFARGKPAHRHALPGVGYTLCLA